MTQIFRVDKKYTTQLFSDYCNLKQLYNYMLPDIVVSLLRMRGPKIKLSRCDMTLH